MTASVEAHHQTGLVRRSTPARDPETERAVPATRRSHSLLDELNLRLPNERAVGEEPKIFAGRVSRQELADHCVIVLLRVVDEVRFWTGVLQRPMHLATRSGVRAIFSLGLTIGRSRHPR